MPSRDPQPRKLPLIKLAVVAVVLAVVALLLLRGVQFGPLIDQAVELLRDLGPVMFFVAAALLPAFGAPLAVFSLAAGEVFAPQLTMPGVIAALLVAIAVNLALTYWLARYAFRPLLTKLVRRYGYSIPSVTPGNALTIALLVRLTPGPPFFLQGYLLGLAEVPFRMFMIVSWLAVLPWSISFVVLGKAAREGNVGKIVTALGVLVAATVAVQMLRRKFARRES